MNSNDLQQCMPGFKTTAIFPGPLTVHVHKALDTIYSNSNSHGFFITVDFKFKQNDALYIGNPGWEGLSKTEATRQAKQLASRIASYHSTMITANNAALNYDNFTNRFTAKLQSERFNNLIAKYNAEIITQSRVLANQPFKLS